VTRFRAPILAIAVAVLFLWLVFPAYWLAKSSLTAGTGSGGGALWPERPTLEFYRELFADAGTGQGDEILRALKNSMIIAALVSLGNVVLGAPAAYAFARYRFRGRAAGLNLLLGTQLVPSVALLLPFYLLFRQVNLSDSLSGLVIAHLAVTLPFSVWILRGQFAANPIDIEKAARVDGASRLRTFLAVALPLAVPSLVVAALFAFMMSWNEFPLSLVLTISGRSTTVQPALAGLQSFQGSNHGLLFAGSVIAAIPPVLVAFVLQGRIRSGMFDAAVK